MDITLESSSTLFAPVLSVPVAQKTPDLLGLANQALSSISAANASMANQIMVLFGIVTVVALIVGASGYTFLRHKEQVETSTREAANAVDAFKKDLESRILAFQTEIDQKQAEIISSARDAARQQQAELAEAFNKLVAEAGNSVVPGVPTVALATQEAQPGAQVLLASMPDVSAGALEKPGKRIDEDSSDGPEVEQDGA